MKKLLLAGIALGAIVAATPVLAADLPFKASPRAVAPAAAFDWSGIYVGAHIGGGWATNDVSDPGLGIVGALLGVPPVQTVDSSGIAGGLQAGWNYQIGRLVVGSEVDFSWADVNGTNTTTFTSALLAPASISRTLTANTDWLVTSTVRLGIAHDRWMVYSKAGAAWAHTNYTSTWVGNPGGVPIFNGAGDKTAVGWTVGLGAEWAFWNNWSAKLEYDFIDFGSKTIPINGVIGGAGGLPASFGMVNDQTISEVKFGVNYKFMPLIW
jgi:outer membrane immunogenic protein